MRKTVKIERQDNGAGVPASYFVRPGSRSRPWIWFAEGDVPDFARRGGAMVIERTGKHRPSHRIIAPAGQ